MSHKIGSVFAAFLTVAVLTTPRVAWAGENEMMEILIHKLVEKGVLSREDAREIRKEVAEESLRMEKARSAETKDTAKSMAGGGWLSTVKWAGDLRLRHETQKREPAQDRNRQRFRLRFGFTAKPVDPIEVGVRLATGTSGDPVSTNQSFSATFDKKAIFIDLAYGKYKPWSWLSLIGGKMENPFWTVKEGTVWDGDVTPEGAALNLKSPNPIPGLDQFLSVTPFATAGAFAISELSTDAGDPALFGGQVGAEVALPMEMKWTPAVAYYDFTGIKNKRTSDVTFSPAGNTTFNPAAAPIFRFDYDLVHFTNRLDLPKILETPVALVGDVVHNTVADGNRTGWMAGTEVGKVTEKLGSWRAAYAYKKLPSDAAFGALTDSDFGTGGTNHEGHIMAVEMGLNKYASMGLKYFRTDEVNGSQAHNDTFQADLQLKF